VAVLVVIAALTPTVFVVIAIMLAVVIAFPVTSVTFCHDATRRQDHQS
jgi:hypothetical protein